MDDRYFVVKIPSSDQRPHAYRRLGLELCRALRTVFRGAEVYEFSRMENVLGKKIQYDPAKQPEKQL